jgi:hypothetical protein
MKRWAGTMLMLASVLYFSPLSSFAADDGWVSLYDGKTLRGWSRVNGEATYESRDGAIVGTTRMASPNSFLATDQKYRDFVLEFDVRQDGGPANSGVQIRSAIDPKYNEGRVFGYQVDIDPSERDWSGTLYDEQRRGWLYPGPLNPSARGVYKMGEWNRFRIEAVGATIRTWVNGTPVAHLIDNVSSEGFIALQIHSIDRSEEAGRTTAWRNIRIREATSPSEPIGTLFVRNTVPNELSPAERAQGWRLLWDARTANGWRSARGASFPARGWSIREGELVLQAGGEGGHIMTEESFAAFDLQFEFRLTPGAESGVFYFMKERVSEEPLGLEYQLRDDTADSEATVDALGSLRGLIARGPLMTNVGIAPRTGEWQHARIVVHLDNRAEHWLNGTKVLEYVRGSRDFRKRVADREGETESIYFLEDARGHILLEDGGKEVRFRSIKIRAL